jgi:sigma-B regulation protein RsbU (phosphoserine phosphatase)
MVPGLSYVAGGCAFPPGSLLLMYTDGVTEAEAEGGTMFGDAALLRLLADGAADGANACVERVITAVDAFSGAHPQSDDITLLAVRHL